jgi:oligoribonuclease NrnB/cAMP/cGMP phosphodiesterase (DHH superfamily)
MGTPEILCLYHDNCTDGIAAAYVVKQYLRFKGCLDIAKFIPVSYSSTIPDVTGMLVFIVDFSYPRETLLELHRKAKGIVVIDHHKTAEAELSDLPFCVFDGNECGATLAWRVLLPDQAVPEIFEYVRDRDLWLWRLDDSREVSAALQEYKKDLNVWDTLTSYGYLDRLKEEGAFLLREQSKKVKGIIKDKLSSCVLEGYTVPCVHTKDYISEVGESLAAPEGVPFSLMYFYRDDGQRVCSMRSAKHGVDVSEIAAKHGGGGHKHAAGFVDFNNVLVINK